MGSARSCDADAQGFYAKPVKAADGSLDLMKWEAGIPGKQGTAWENGMFKLWLLFPEEYPTRPPKCKDTPPPILPAPLRPIIRRFRLP